MLNVSKVPKDTPQQCYVHYVKSAWLGVFLVPTFPHSNWIQKDKEYLPVFSPNAGKYGPEKLQIRTLFTQWSSEGYLGRYQTPIYAIVLQKS